MNVNCLDPVRINVNPDKSEFARPHYIHVGCGKCPLCLRKKGNEWNFRLRHMAKFADDCYFITLTYAPEHLPNYGDNGLHNVQCFLKRFRKNNNLIPGYFRYFLISELGGEHGRLHYHAILFNTGMNWMELAKALRRDWSLGRIDVKHINQNRINYVSKYTLQNLYRGKRFYLKEVTTKKNKYGGSVTSFVKVRIPNYFFMVCSKGIGLDFLTKKMINYILDRGDGCVQENGFTIAIPRYYMSHLEKIDKEKTESIKSVRLTQAIKTYEQTLEILGKYNRRCKEAARCGEIPPPEPEELLEARERARQIREKAKKCKFTSPPISTYVNIHKSPNSKTEAE